MGNTATQEDNILVFVDLSDDAKTGDMIQDLLERLGGELVSVQGLGFPDKEPVTLDAERVYFFERLTKGDQDKISSAANQMNVNYKIEDQ